MNKYVIVVHTGYSWRNSFRPSIFELDKVTACFVFAATYWGRRTRYDRQTHKFKFFDTEHAAKNELMLMNIRCGVVNETKARETLEDKTKTATDLVRSETMSWTEPQVT